MKRKLRNIVASVLGSQVKRLRKRNKFIVIAVAGSIGKTSTKMAVAHVLSQGYKVQYQQGNYNDLVSVPLIFFGKELPSLFNPFAWAVVFLHNERVIRSKYPYEIVVVELGSDAPGQLKQFKQYLQADIGILTAIVPEHMANFADLDAVAKEEMTLAELSTKLFVNKDLCAEEYLKLLPPATVTYGIKQLADIRMSNIHFNDEGADFEITYGPITFLKGSHERVTEPQLYSICAAVAVATELEMTTTAVDKGIRELTPVNGRMQRLRGHNNSIIIDDTYNASPEAVKGALDTLYRIQAPQKIAILGNMNELGGYSQKEHQAIGEYCDPRELTLVVTIGPDANKYLAPAAEEKGCLVKTFDNPVDAGKFVSERLQPEAIVLAKGSQNGVFAEEAVKQLLDDPKDAQKLVRQSKRWMKIKHKNFPSVRMG
jgi:UDP-N-acetylmuramoyl-tripeptide--D-alanyl-D-alanine ligase